MSRGINKVILVGNLGADPETKYTQSGSAITNLSVATSESWTDKQSGQKQERTEWHRVVGFNRLAEIMGEYLRKGSKVYIEGQLRTRKWQDQQGSDRYSTEIVASEMQMLDSREGLPGAEQARQPRQAPARQPYQAPQQGGGIPNAYQQHHQPPQRQQPPAQQQMAMNGPGEPDDVPF